MKIKEFIKKSYPYAEKKFGKKLSRSEFVNFGLRGYTVINGELVRNDNKFNYFNDCNIWSKGEQIDPYISTLDPGLPYIKKPLNEKGTASLMAGIWKFKKGLHRGEPAFIQAEPVSVRRDQNRDGKWTQDELIETGWFGIHMHFAYTVLDFVGWTSAGCTAIQAFKTSLTWIKYRDTLYGISQDSFSYCVLDQEHVDEILGKK